MKTPRIILSIVLTAIAMVIAQNANALVRLDGSFVPSQCGQNQVVREVTEPAPEVDIQQVCVGHVSGSKGDAVQFRLTNGDEQLFRVSHTANYLMAFASGDMKSMYYLVSEDGQTSAMKVIRTREGMVRSVAGTLNGISYYVSEMQMIFTIQ